MALALAVAVLAVAYATAAPQLAVAEFAPSAQRAIEPPPTSSPLDAARSSDGRGARGGAAAAASTSTAPTGTASTTPDSAATTRVARARTCVGDPPRQTEDPLSPACAATIFEGDNGGATARGVSATEIRVAVPSGSALSTPQRDAVEGLFEYFNNRFELYGRRFVPVYVTGSASDSVSGRALAADVAGRGAFAAITAPLEKTSYSAPTATVNELARAQVLTIGTNVATWWSDRIVFDPLHPYVWSVFPSAEQVQRNLGAVACSLAGKKAAFATDSTLAGQPRKFGIYSAGAESAPNVSALSETIERCTGEAPARLNWTAAAGSTVLDTGMQRMAAAGVTTVICVCERWYMNDALFGSAGVDREWLIPNSGYFGSDEYLIGAIRSGGRLRGGTMLVSAGPRLLPLAARPWFGALLSTRASLADSTSTATGGAYANAGFVMGEPTYAQLLLLASGVQAAGPTLTADTFAQGLMGSSFPNPNAGQAPYWQPSVGFGPGDHGFYNDFSIGWWSGQEAPVDPGNGDRFVGSFCYVGRGTRFTVSSVPDDLTSQLFAVNAPCR